MTQAESRRWYRVMLCYPVEVLADDAEDALDEAMVAFLTELDENGLDVAHDLLASDSNDVYLLDENYDLSTKEEDR